MTYVVIDNCIACKYTDCVEVCPVDCFYEGENMLVIHPDECIDCGVCEPECPADAIRPDTEPAMESWVELNRKYAELWPVITRRKDALPDAKDRDGETGKLAKYFSETPGSGGLTRACRRDSARTWRAGGQLWRKSGEDLQATPWQTWISVGGRPPQFELPRFRAIFPLQLDEETRRLRKIEVCGGRFSVRSDVTGADRATETVFCAFGADKEAT